MALLKTLNRILWPTWWTILVCCTVVVAVIGVPIFGNNNTYIQATIFACAFLAALSFAGAHLGVVVQNASRCRRLLKKCRTLAAIPRAILIIFGFLFTAMSVIFPTYMAIFLALQIYRVLFNH